MKHNQPNKQKKRWSRKQTQKFAENGKGHLNVNKIVNPDKERLVDK